MKFTTKLLTVALIGTGFCTIQPHQTVHAQTTKIVLNKKLGYTKNNVINENRGTITRHQHNRLVKASIDGMVNNHYHYSDTESDRIVDLNHLSKSDQELISKYVLKVINSARRQFNQTPWVYSNVSRKFANRVALEYTKDNMSCWDADHDVKGIQRAAKRFGLNTNGQYYEDESGLVIGEKYKGQYYAGSKRPLALLKKQLYFNIQQMLFGGYTGFDSYTALTNPNHYYEWQHAGDLLNAREMSWGKQAKKFAVSFSILPSKYGDKISVHMINVHPRLIENHKKFR